MLKRINQGTLFGPLAFAGLIALVLLLAGALMLARTVDTRAVKREQTVILNGMIGKRHEIAKSVAAQLVWDEAVRHLDNRFDPAWARDNIGKFFFDTQQMARAGSVAKIVKLEHAWRRLDGRNDDGFQVAPFPG